MSRNTYANLGEGPENGDHDGPLLSMGEAARREGVDISTIRRWCDTGKIPSTRTVGGHRRVPLSALGANDSLATLPARKAAPNLVVPALAQIAVDWQDWTPPKTVSDETLAALANAIDGGGSPNSLIGDLAMVAAICRAELDRRHPAEEPPQESPAPSPAGLPAWTARQP